MTEQEQIGEIMDKDGMPAMEVHEALEGVLEIFAELYALGLDDYI